VYSGDDGMDLGAPADGFSESKPGFFAKIKNMFSKKR